MRTQLIFCFVSLVFVACSAVKTAPQRVSEAPDIVQLSVVLADVADGNTTLTKCNIKATQAKRILLLAQARWDASIKDYLRKNKSAKALGKDWLDCRRDCSCSYYLSILEQAKPSMRDKNSFATVRSQAEATTASERASCAQRSQEICQGPLVASFVKELEQEAPSDY